MTDSTDNVVPLRDDPASEALALTRKNLERQKQLGVVLNPLDMLYGRLHLLIEQVLSEDQRAELELRFQHLVSGALDSAEANMARQKLLKGTPLEGQLSIDDALGSE